MKTVGKTVRVFLVLVVTTGLLFGCSGGEKSREARKGSPPPPIEPSHITIPIDVSLDTVARQVASKVPKVLKEKGYEGDPEGIKYTVTRGTISLSARGDTLYMSVPVSFTAEMKRKGAKTSKRPRLRGRRGGSGGALLSCEASLTLTFESKLTITSDWRLQSKTTPGPRKWTKPCEMTPLKIDVTKKVDAKLEEKVNEIVSMLDSRITKAVDIRGKVTRAWTSLQKPKQMQQGFWLTMNPESIAMAPLRGEGDSLKTNVAIIAHPKISMTPPPAAEPLPLPPNSGEASGDTYYIAIEASLPFGEATAQARQKLVGQSYEVQGQKLEVKDVRIMGDGDYFLIEVSSTGALDATVALSGRPHYDVPTGLLTVEDLDYTVDTKNFLTNAADWLLHGTLQEFIANKARFPLGDKIEQGKAGLEQALNKQLTETTTLRGTAERIRPLGVYVTENAFLVIVVAEGKMWLEVR